MLGFLFRGLTGERSAGAALFEALTGEARQTHWYLEGDVPDTLDGRFAVLATLTALALVRLEQNGAEGDRISVALTERFIEVMESEHRELGLGDPTLGKTVRKLVGMLARRTELWREALSGGGQWADATRESLYRHDVSDPARENSEAALKEYSGRLDATSLGQLEKGVIA